MTPEQKARVSIDALLVAAGWHVCNVSDANIHAATGVVEGTEIRGFSYLLPPIAELACHLFIIREVETILQRARALRQATSANAYFVQRELRRG